MPEPTILRAVLGDYPHTRPIADGEITSPEVRLDLQPVRPVHRAFAPMVRETAYDVSELAIVTALQALAFDRPIVVLPAVVAARFQRGCLVSHGSRPITEPGAIVGARVGVRAYTQTTGMWVREHLAEDAGVDADRIRWVTRDPAHVQEYADPAFVDRSLGDRDLLDALRDGTIDAAIFGNDLPDSDELVRVWPDAEQRDRQWWTEHGFVPINHLVVVSRTLYDAEPAAVRATYDLLRRADDTVERAADEPVPTRFGVEALLAPIQTVADACLAQDLLPRPLTAEEILAPAQRLLARPTRGSES